MKTLLKIFFPIIISSSLFAQANVYHPFPDSNAVWREFYSEVQTPWFHCIDYENYLNGDTLSGNLVYKQLWQRGVDYGWWSNCQTGVYFNNYIGAIRQNIIQKKIFFLPSGYLTDTLLYDFNLNVNDTLPLTYNNFITSNYVSAIDSVLVGNNYHKRYHISDVSNNNYVDIIEGVGSTFGLLQFIVPPFESGSSLNCFLVDGDALYPDTTFNCGLGPVYIFENKKNQVFNISPNPTIGIFTIYSDDHSLKKYLLSIYDVFGKRVLNDNISSASPINISSQPNGIYFFQIRGEDGESFHSKLVLQK